MDIKNLVASIKSSRNIKIAAIAVGILTIAAGGGAYFFLVYQPEMEKERATAMPPVAAKPKPATALPAAKPPNVEPTAPGKAPPAVVSAGQQPAIVNAPGATSPVPQTATEPVKPVPAAQKEAPIKSMAETKTEQVDKPAQADKKAGKQEASEMSQQVTPQSHDVPLTQTFEPVGQESATDEEPVQQRRGVTPKYNDIMTPVLRGDREAVKELLELGWWVDKPSVDGITPLMAAVNNRDTQMVQLLLDYGAEPSTQALKLARKNKDAAIESLLVQKGAR